MIIPIKKIGDTGVISDYAAYDVPPNVVTDAVNVDFKDGRVIRSRGWADLYDAGETVAHLVGFYTDVEDAHIIVTPTKILKKTSLANAPVDITPQDAADFAPSDQWQHDFISNVLLLNNGLQVPLLYAPNQPHAVKLSEWDYTGTSWICDEVRPFAGFLVATGISKAGKKLGYVVKWSDALSDDVVSSPPKWDEADPTLLTGENPISSASGEIITQRELNGSNIIYCQNSVHSMQYVGGQFVFRFRELFDDDGIYNRNAVVEFFNNHLVVGYNSIYVHDGNTKQQIANGRVQRRFYDELGDKASVYVVNDVNNRNIIIHYNSKAVNVNQNPDQVPPEGGRAFNAALVFDYDNNTWTFRRFPFVSELAAVVPQIVGTALTWATIPADHWKTWDAKSWADLAFVDGESYLTYAIGQKVTQSDVGYTFNGQTYVSAFEMPKIDFDDALKSHFDVLSLTRIYMQAKGSGTMKIKVASTMTANETANFEKAPERLFRLSDNLGAAPDYKIDLRITGRYLGIQILQDDVGDFEVSGFDVEVVQDGIR